MRNNKNKGTKNPQPATRPERTHLWVSPELNTSLQVFAKLNGYRKAADVVAAGLELLKAQKGAVAA